MLARLVIAVVVAVIAAVTSAPARGASPAPPPPDGIIAVLIGAKQPLTAPIGSTKGSFIDASAVYGSSD
jgi:hypothetical protein